VHRTRRTLRHAQSWRWEPTGATAAGAAEDADWRWSAARAKAIAWAVGVTGDPRVVYLDTETTGFGPRAEIVDIAVVGAAGDVLFESLVRPSRRIPPDASAIHGLTDRDVADAPGWCDIYDEVRRILDDRRVVVYNVSFDRGMVTQSCSQHGLPAPDADWDCAMKKYASFHGSWDAKKRWYRFQKLERAVLAFGAEPGGHRAAADAFACRTVVLGMAATPPPVLDADGPDIDTSRPWHVPAMTPQPPPASAAPTPATQGSTSMLARWRAAARTFIGLIEEVPVDLRDQAGACGVWSPREVLAHCAGWEWEAARRLRLIAADPMLPDAVYDVDGFNAASVAVRARQSWDTTVDELAKAIRTLSAAAAIDPDSPRTAIWLQGRAEDFEGHTAELRHWLTTTTSVIAQEHARRLRLRR
jgi:DNA polymerase III subunit epsilon